MHYLALLISQDVGTRTRAAAEGMAAFQAFHASRASAIRAGDAPDRSATATRIAGGLDHPTVTDGPFAEGAEVACGYYVFEADNLDEALALARDIPVAQFGAVEVWPMVHWQASGAAAGQRLAGTAAGAAEDVNTPGTDEWNAAGGAARRTRQDHRRSGRWRRAAASAVHRDHRAGPRRQGDC